MCRVKLVTLLTGAVLFSVLSSDWSYAGCPHSVSSTKHVPNWRSLNPFRNSTFFMILKMEKMWWNWKFQWTKLIDARRKYLHYFLFVSILVSLIVQLPKMFRNARTHSVPCGAGTFPTIFLRKQNKKKRNSGTAIVQLPLEWWLVYGFVSSSCLRL